MNEPMSEQRKHALLELYQLFRRAWLRQGDLTRESDRKEEHRRMVSYSDVIEVLEKNRE